MQVSGWLNWVALAAVEQGRIRFVFVAILWLFVSRFDSSIRGVIGVVFGSVVAGSTRKRRELTLDGRHPVWNKVKKLEKT